MLLEALQYPFFRRALLAGLLASVAGGVVGTYVVVRRISSITGGLAHAAFGGVGLGYLLGFDPTAGGLGFGVLAALGVGAAEDRLRAGFDTLVMMVWAVGMALGIAFISLSTAEAPDLMSYLFGNILFVPDTWLGLVAGLDLLLLLCVWLWFRELRAVAFDPEFAEVVGLPVRRLYLLLLVLVALTVVTLIRVAGVILVIALLTMPAGIARHWSSRLGHVMVGATLTGAVLVTAGLFLAYGVSSALGLDVPTGPLIILVAGGAFAASAALRSRVTRRPGPSVD